MLLLHFTFVGFVVGGLIAILAGLGGSLLVLGALLLRRRVRRGGAA